MHICSLEVRCIATKYDKDYMPIIKEQLSCGQYYKSDSLQMDNNNSIAHQITDSLHQLINHPKKATLDIQQLYSNCPNFLDILTDLITKQPSANCYLPAPLLRSALATFNSLTTRALRTYQRKPSNQLLQSFFLIDHMYTNLKTILFNHTLDFKHKIIISPALTKFMCLWSIKFTEIKQLSRQAQKQRCQDSLLIVLECVLSVSDNIKESSYIQHAVKVQCIDLLFMGTLDAVDERLKIMLNYRTGQNDNGITYSSCVYVVGHWLKLLKIISCQFARNCTLSHQECETMQRIYQNQLLGSLLLRVLEFSNPVSQQYRFLWLYNLTEIHDSNHVLISYCTVNQLKSLTFLSIAQILKKMDKQYNLKDTNRCLMANLPKLCQDVYQDAIRIGRSFTNLKGQHDMQICTHMFEFLSQCLNFRDCQPLIFHGLTHSRHSYRLSYEIKSQFQALIMYLQIDRSERQDYQNEPDHFAAYLQAINDSQMQNNQLNVSCPRFAVAQFIRNCCNKIDSFAYLYFELGFTTLVNSLCCLKVGVDNHCLEYLIQVDKETCLLALHVICPVLYTRRDLQQVLKEMIGSKLHLERLSTLQLTVLLRILTELIVQPRNDLWIADVSFMECLSRVLRYGLTKVHEEDITCFVIMLQFVSHLHKQLIKQVHHFEQSQHEHQQHLQTIYRHIISHEIYPQLINHVQKCQQFRYFQLLQDIIQNCKNITLLDFQTQILQQLKHILISSCHKLSSLYHKEIHDEMLCLRVHQLIVKTIQQIFDTIISKSSSNQNRMQLESDFNDRQKDIAGYLSIVENFVCTCLNPQKNINDYTGEDVPEECYLTVEEKQTMVELIGLPITKLQQIPALSNVICKQTVELVFPIVLSHPFCNKWLQCFCYIITQTDHKLSYQHIQSLNVLLQNQCSKTIAFSHKYSQNQKAVIYHTYEQNLNQMTVFVSIMMDIGYDGDLCEKLTSNWLLQRQLVDKIEGLLVVIVNEYNPLIFKSDNRDNDKEIGHYGRWRPLQITVVRTLHMYLMVCTINNRLLTQILEKFNDFIPCYGIWEAYTLINCLKLLYQSNTKNNGLVMEIQKNNNSRNGNKIQSGVLTLLFSHMIEIMRKLHVNQMYHGQRNETKWQYNVRNICKRIKYCRKIDPFDRLRQFIELIDTDNHNFLLSQTNRQAIDEIMKVKMINGEPRKLISIRGIRKQWS